MKTYTHQYKPLKEKDIQRIDQASMEVFLETGFEVHQPEAFELFKQVAHSVDEEKGIIKLREETVRELIAKAPSEVTLYGRDTAYDCELGRGNVYFGTGGTALNMLDYGETESRLANLKDLEEVIRVVDRMDNIDLCLLPTYPSEIDAEHVDIKRFSTGLTYTNKHIMGGVYTSQGIHDVIRMAENIAGSPEALREKPFISLITCGISPLRLDSKYGAYMIQAAREGIPLAVPAEPLCGATAPMSLAGALVIQNCDALINVMLTQLVNPGTPVIYGCVASSMDMNTMSYLGSPIESGMINAATAQMTQYYHLPYYATAGISDSKTLDAQCGYESALSNLLVGMAGADFIHDAAGLMEFALTVSLEKLVIDNEIIGMAKRAIQGVDVSENTLCLDDIKKAGPGGNFVTSRSTRKFMRKEHYQPQLSDRSQRGVWTSEGATSAAQRAHTVVQNILRETPKKYVDLNSAYEAVEGAK
ncbi:MAG: trimethylamine methyltransferase family protein [Spirochaetota bacterium]